jgi:hypothetical protein
LPEEKGRGGVHRETSDHILARYQNIEYGQG